MANTSEDLAAINNLPFTVPDDFRDFLLTDHANDDYDENMFRFYRAASLKTVNDELGSWAGSPDYTNIIHTLPGHEHYLVFADYMMHVLTYAIQLSESEPFKHEIIVICGDRWKPVASSLSAFWQQYREGDFQRLMM